MLGEWTAIMTILRPVRMRATIWPFSEERNVASNSVGFILALVLLPGVAQGVVTPVGVLTGPEDQWQAFANQTWLTWTTEHRPTPESLERAGSAGCAAGRAGRVNAAGTMGFAGNFDPGTDCLIYEQGTPRDVGIFFYDVSDKRRWKVLRVSTRARSSGNLRFSTAFILFQRDQQGEPEVVHGCAPVR